MEAGTAPARAASASLRTAGALCPSGCAKPIESAVGRPTAASRTIDAGDIVVVSTVPSGARKVIKP